MNAVDEAESVFEVSSAKKRQLHNLPVVIAFMVYGYAKLRMLQLHYDLIRKYCDPQKIEKVYMDTDSYYCGVAGDDLEDIVLDEHKEEFNDIKNNWFPRQTPSDAAEYDRRTPGLFKVEWKGRGFVGLNAKTVYCYQPCDTFKDKFSCKGVQRALNDVTKDMYLSVLDSGKSIEVNSRGFRRVGKSVYTYTLKKDAFNYVYYKRKILNGGIRSTYLDI